MAKLNFLAAITLVFNIKLLIRNQSNLVHLIQDSLMKRRLKETYLFEMIFVTL